MRFLVTEKLGPHKFKTPEGYLICTDAILSRTGKQEYKRCELFGDACEDPDKIVNVERTDDEVFSDKAMASFENKAVCIEHPDHDVNAENHNELAVGFVRDIHKGEDNGKPVMMGTLVITDKDAVEAVESGEYKELSCGYDCDIDDNDLSQRNIRGNHVALCKQGRAGIARIVDSTNDDDSDINWLRALDRHNIKFDFINGGYSMRFKSNADYSMARKLAIQCRMKHGYWDDKALTYSDYRSTTISQDDSIKTDDSGIKVWQVHQGYAIVAEKYWRQYGKNAFVDATESSIEAARYHRGSLERNDRMSFVIIDCNDGRYKIEDDKMKDIQVTKKPGVDKIIYVMQSDIDENLFFYIGKTFSMKEGAWGYTKFEMSGTTPEQLKAELSKNGWHQVTNGPARVIDMNDERLIKRTELNVGMNIRWKYHGEQYEGRIKHVEQRGSYTKIDYEDKRGIGASFAFENEPITTTDSWTEVEEENYKKANKPIGAKDEEYVQLPRGRFKLVAKTKEELEKEGYGYHHSDRGYSVYVKNNQAVVIKDSVKEKLFTIEFEKDGITHIHKVRANSIEDAISKVKDNGHKVVVFTNQVLNELGKNNSIGKYDRVVQAMRSLYSESLLPDNELKILIRKKVPEYIKKYVKE